MTLNLRLEYQTVYVLAYTYQKHGCFSLQEKPKPTIQNDRDAIVRVTLASICTSDLHIKHGSSTC